MVTHTVTMVTHNLQRAEVEIKFLNVEKIIAFQDLKKKQFKIQNLTLIIIIPLAVNISGLFEL